MTTIKLHYDGWLTLPAGLRQTLGLNSGDRIEVTLVDGALVLRPASKKTAASRATTTKASGNASSPATTTSPTGGSAQAVVPESKARESQDGSTAPTATAAAAPKRRGRPPKVPVAQAPLPPADPLVGIGPARLLKKAELEARPTAADAVLHPPVPARRLRPDSGAPPVERRPFRNVEVRSLGAGRAHGKRRQPTSSSSSRLFS